MVRRRAAPNRDTGGLQPQKRGKGIADERAAKQCRHNLIELDFPTLDNGISEENHKLYHDQYCNMLWPLVIPRHHKYPDAGGATEHHD